MYGHRLLPGALRDGLPPIDNSWGAYGAQEDGGGDDYIRDAYSRWLGLGADERSPLGQAAVLSEHTRRSPPNRRCTSSTSPCRTGHGCCRRAGTPRRSHRS